ncbi:MAG: S-adenosylmethionine decarboxylase [Bacilli bacterium]
MKHVMLDCYGSTQTLLDDIRYINKIMNEIPFILKLVTVTPPQLVPYYYGKVKEDDGISSFVFLEGGHITIHTFPFRQCYFVDIFSKDFDTEALENYLLEKLPYNPSLSSIEIRDRDITVFNQLPYNPKEDFGPHVLSEIAFEKRITMENMFDFLEKLVYEIGMTPITRPLVIKSTIRNTHYLSGIILIAQSHISLHYDYENKVIYFDIFSCASFDFSMVTNVLSDLGKVTSYEVVARGTKHYSKVKHEIDTTEAIASEKWQKNIYNDCL